MARAHPQTLASWFRGPRPLVPNRQDRSPLSYLQLVEGAFVASFRAAGVSLQQIRRARDYLSEMFSAEYPFAQLKLKTDGVHILKEMPDGGGLIVANRYGQEGWEQILSDRIAQFDYQHDLAMCWHLRGRNVPIVVDPRVSFGVPTVRDRGIATWVLANRVRAGEPRESILEDFPYVTTEEFSAALEFEGVQQAA